MEPRHTYVSDRQSGPQGAPHILFVDDEPGLRKLVRHSLQGCGYRVTTCSHTEEAIAFYRDHHDDVDLVIVDMLMPGMSGLDAMKRMKGIDPDVRVVLSSAYVPDQESEDVMLHGFVDSLPKPFETDELCDLVARHVGGQAEVPDGA